MLKKQKSETKNDLAFKDKFATAKSCICLYIFVGIRLFVFRRSDAVDFFEHL